MLNKTINMAATNIRLYPSLVSKWVYMYVILRHLLLAVMWHYPQNRKNKAHCKLMPTDEHQATKINKKHL